MRAFVVPDLWRYRNPETKAGHKNSGHEAIGIVEETGEAIMTVKPGDFVIVPLPMAVGSVMPVLLALTVLATIMLVITWEAIFRRNIFVFTMQTGRWLKSLDNLLTTQKVCSSHF